MTITIISADGSATRTANVEMSNAQTHIAARDRYHNEAEILLAYDADETLVDRDPIAFKFNDPIEPARFLFDESEVAEIEQEDPSLIERIVVVWE
jgi:hypothetical protein